METFPQAPKQQNICRDWEPSADSFQELYFQTLKNKKPTNQKNFMLIIS